MMNKETNTIRNCGRRAAMLLLLAMMTATTAWAELKCICTPEDGGTVTVDGRKVYPKPKAGYYVATVVYTDGNTGIELSEAATIVDEEPYYLAPNENGTVTVTFHQWTDDVLVKFSNAHGSAPENQQLKLGQKVQRPDTDPEAAGYEFLGWFISGTDDPYDFDAVLTDDLFYNKRIHQYTLTIKAEWLSTSDFSGKCGKVDGSHDGSQLTWALDKSEGSDKHDLLTIIGTGDMAGYSTENHSPWYKYRKAIKHIVIGEGVKTIGNYAFYGISNLESDLVIPASATNIKGRAFENVASINASSITFATGCPLTEITKNAFQGTKINVDLSNAKKCTKIGVNAFHKAVLPSGIVIPASVTTIDKTAFKNVTGTAPDACITLSVGSQLTEINNNAFQNSKINIDLSNAASLTTLPKKKGIFKDATGDVTLPASLTLIEPSKKQTNTTFDSYKGNHVYFYIPSGNNIILNGEEYSGELTADGKADIIGKVINGKKGQAISISWKNTPKYNITVSDDIVKTYYYGTDATPAANAAVGETVVLSWGGDNVPGGKYVSDFTFSVPGVVAKANEDNSDYTFVMPGQDVTVTSVLSDQEEYTLDLTTDTQVIIPETMYTLLNTLNGYFYSEKNAEGTQFLTYIDIDRDGTPDLQLLTPPYDEELEKDEDETTTGDEETGDEDEEEEEDPFYYEYSVKRLAGADALAKNYRFALAYPFPYRYNKLLVKLDDAYDEQEQPSFESLNDQHDNTTMLTEWVKEGKTYNFIIDERTLYRDGDWNTLCLPFAVSSLDGTPLEGATIMELDTEGTYNGHQTGVEGTTLYLNFKAATGIEAGKPYIVKWGTPATDIYAPVFMGVTITTPTKVIPDPYFYSEDPEAVPENVTMATPTDVSFTGGKFRGTYDPTVIYSSDHSKYFLGSGNTLYYPTTEGYTINSFRAYFDLTTAVDAREFVLNFNDGMTTGITDMKYDNAHAGHVWYTLDGRKLDGKPAKKGVYIRNGKKTVVK